MQELSEVQLLKMALEEKEQTLLSSQETVQVRDHFNSSKRHVK